MMNSESYVNFSSSEGDQIKGLMVDVSRQVDAAHRLAFERLVDYFGGSMTRMGEYFNYKRSAISNMRIRGKITTTLAQIVDSDPRMPFTLEELRADHVSIRQRAAQRGTQYAKNPGKIISPG